MLPRLVLEGPLFQHYFDKVEVSNFEVASDAFSTFKVDCTPTCMESTNLTDLWCQVGISMKRNLI